MKRNLTRSLSERSEPKRSTYGRISSRRCAPCSMTGCSQLPFSRAPAFDGIHPAFDERLPLRVTPTLKTLLETERLIYTRELVAPHKSDWEPARGVGTPLPLRVLLEPAFEIRGAPDVVGTVRAFEYVGVAAHAKRVAMA